MKPSVLLIVVLLWQISSQTLRAQEAIIDYKTRFLPAFAKQGMVASPEKIAAEAGVDILKMGGNAVDAAVATGFALAVTYPRAGNLAGGGFMLVHLAETHQQTLIDYRESAPAAAHRDMFLNEEGEVERMREWFSHRAAGVPGSVAGMIYAQEKYGSLPLRKVLQPAIDLAANGFPVSYALDYEIAQREEMLLKDPEARKIFFREDASRYPVGSNFKQPDLAWTLQHIQKKGLAGFYQGPVADRIVANMEANDGLISHEDLTHYAVIERQPVRGKFRQDYEIVATPPPSAGGVHIIQILNIMEGYDNASWGHNSAAYLHHLAESMKLAYADRSKYLGDPGYLDVPVEQLISKGYASSLRKLIKPRQATASQDIKPGRALAYESEDTTHYTVADRWGNVVANTYTLNFSFGSHIAVPGTGMLLNNEMADFAAKPGVPNAFGLIDSEANAIAPGKRPLSSMTPTLVLKDGRPWLATGSPGGSTIITAVLQTIINAMEFDMNLATAAAGARIHHQWMPDRLTVERGVSPDTVQLLQNWGHNVAVGRRTLGRTQSIMLDNGLMYGATDTRRLGGWVAGY